jgi:hypothetical protein
VRGWWWAICPRDATLKRVKVRGSVSESPLGGWVYPSWNGCEGAALFVRNVPGLSARSLPTAGVQREWAASDVRARAHTELLLFGAERWTVRYETANLSDELVVLSFTDAGGRVEQLRYHEQAFSFGDAQPTTASETNEIDDWRVRWAGDLDGDGKLDAVIELSLDAGIQVAVLLLSKDAGGHMLRPAAHIAWGGD